MASGRRATAKGAAAAAAVFLIFAATWLLLDRTERRPRWLTLEAPEFVTVGRTLEIRVTLDRSVEATQISCTLHRTRADRKGGNYLASSGPARPAVGGGTYSFVFEVPEHKDMAFAFGLVYLSPTGQWKDGTRAVSTKHLPVRRDGSLGEGQGLKRIPVYHFLTAAESEAARAAGPRLRGRPSGWVHPVLCVLLLSSAVLCAAKAGWRKPRTGLPGRPERSLWLAFAAVLVLSAILEISGLVGHLAAWGRRLAEAENLYELRKPFQKAIMAAAAAAGSGLSILFIRAMRRPGAHRHLWGAGIGLAVYLAVSFVSVLSFHAIDVVRGLTWHGVSPVDAVRGGGALVSFFAALFALVATAGKPRD